MIITTRPIERPYLSVQHDRTGLPQAYSRFIRDTEINPYPTHRPTSRNPPTNDRRPHTTPLPTTIPNQLPPTTPNKNIGISTERTGKAHPGVGPTTRVRDTSRDNKIGIPQPNKTRNPQYELRPEGILQGMHETTPPLLTDTGPPIALTIPAQSVKPPPPDTTPTPAPSIPAPIATHSTPDTPSTSVPNTHQKPHPWTPQHPRRNRRRRLGRQHLPQLLHHRSLNESWYDSS